MRNGSKDVARTVIGHKHLFIDDAHVHSVSRLERIYHQPSKHATPVLLPDRPWEQATPRTTCPAALFLWSPAIRDQATSKWQIWYCGGRHALPLYAESTDGTNWTKPDLGLVRWDGSTQNNIVSLLPPDGYSTSWKHNRLVMVRDDSDPNPHRRYKAWTAKRASAPMAWNLFPLFSSDGLRWRQGTDSFRSGDDYRLAYDPTARIFLATIKLYPRDVPDYVFPTDHVDIDHIGTPLPSRSVWLRTSTDFRNWSEPRLIMYGNRADQQDAAAFIAAAKTDPNRRRVVIDDPASIPVTASYKIDTYNMTVFRYEDLLLGLPTRNVMSGQYSWSHGAESGFNQDGYQYPFLVSSRDTGTWDRHTGEPFIDLSPLTDTDKSDYGMIQATPPVRNGDELWFYYWGARSTHHFWHELTPEQYTKAAVAPDERATSPTAAIYLARLRLDGFVSLRAGATPGELLTKTVEIGGGNLHVNASAARGELRAEVRDADTGRPLAGYTLADAVPVTTDAVSAPVRWAANADVSRLTGRNINLRFVLERGDLYAFWFE